jgi:hypothetical protein
MEEYGGFLNVNYERIIDQYISILSDDIYQQSIFPPNGIPISSDQDFEKRVEISTSNNKHLIPNFSILANTPIVILIDVTQQVNLKNLISDEREKK